MEEREGEEDDLSYTQSHENASTYATSTSQPGDETLNADDNHHERYDETDDSLLDNGDISGSTPRAPRPKSASSDVPKFAEYPSSYETLKEELRGPGKQPEQSEENLPLTPGAQSRIPDMSMTPTSSPFDPTSYLQSTAQKRPGGDPLLHRVLDKNYRIQATPHLTRKELLTNTMNTPANKPSWRDTTSPMSSPPVAAPQLHAEIFSSPIRQQYSSKPSAPRTPGVSVQTPVKRKEKTPKASKQDKDEITWESDSDDEDAEGVYRELGMSPPKTIQFNLPQSRLLQTPGM